RRHEDWREIWPQRDIGNSNKGRLGQDHSRISFINCCNYRAKQRFAWLENSAVVRRKRIRLIPQKRIVDEVSRQHAKMTARSAAGCTHPPTWLTKPLQALNPEWLCSILEKDADLSLETSATSHLISIYLVPGSKILLQQEAEPSNRVTEGEGAELRKVGR